MQSGVVVQSTDPKVVSGPLAGDPNYVWRSPVSGGHQVSLEYFPQVLGNYLWLLETQFEGNEESFFDEMDVRVYMFCVAPVRFLGGLTSVNGTRRIVVVGDTTFDIQNPHADLNRATVSYPLPDVLGGVSPIKQRYARRRWEDDGVTAGRFLSVIRSTTREDELVAEIEFKVESDENYRHAKMIGRLGDDGSMGWSFVDPAATQPVPLSDQTQLYNDKVNGQK